MAKPILVLACWAMVGLSLLLMAGVLRRSNAAGSDGSTTSAAVAA